MIFASFGIDVFIRSRLQLRRKWKRNRSLLAFPDFPFAVAEFHLCNQPNHKEIENRSSSSFAFLNY
jgi:hypothetical protein